MGHSTSINKPFKLWCQTMKIGQRFPMLNHLIKFYRQFMLVHCSVIMKGLKNLNCSISVSFWARKCNLSTNMSEFRQNLIENVFRELKQQKPVYSASTTGALSLNLALSLPKFTKKYLKSFIPLWPKL